MQIDLKAFNVLLNQIITKDGSHISRERNDDDDFIVYIYKTTDPEVFIKAVWEQDSYGGDDRIISVQFVRATTKTVLDYKPL